MRPGNIGTFKRLLWCRYEDYWHFFFEKDERKNIYEGQQQIIAEYIGWA